MDSHASAINCVWSDQISLEDWYKNYIYLYIFSRRVLIFRSRTLCAATSTKEEDLYIYIPMNDTHFPLQIPFNFFPLRHPTHHVQQCKLSHLSRWQYISFISTYRLSQCLMFQKYFIRFLITLGVPRTSLNMKFKIKRDDCIAVSPLPDIMAALVGIHEVATVK